MRHPARSSRYLARGMSGAFALGVVLVMVLVPSAAGSSPSAVAPGVEAQNFAKINERLATYLKPEVLAVMLDAAPAVLATSLTRQLADPTQVFLSDLCGTNGGPCMGDVRLARWVTGGYGLSVPVSFTLRTGARASGHVWATRAGPRKRPLVVITNGSIQADEQMYWWAAQTLAKAGYVVLTWDPQNQGRTSTFGTGRDLLSGADSQLSGQTFYQGTVDALDFALSTPGVPYCPRPASVSHCVEQRVGALQGTLSAFNPFSEMVDPRSVGLAGHSFGATGVSAVAQQDPRVGAVVAWDNLCVPAPGGCQVGSQPGQALRVPALGLSQDYSGVPTPYLSPPDPAGREGASLDYSKAGVDSGEIVIRGGTHFEYSYVPLPTFPATLRGVDMAAWYTTAWFDKYLKHDPAADRRLFTSRWQTDVLGQAVDQGHDANDFSFYFNSRLNVTSGRGRMRCETLRSGCALLTAQDGWSGTYSVVDVATSPDHR